MGKLQKADPTGRSLPYKADPRQSPKVWEGSWTSIGQELLESFAWRALSDSGRRVVDRVIFEHILHKGSRNGLLPVTYMDFVKWGIRKSSIRPSLAEAVALGLLERTEQGRRAYGEFKGKPALYRLAWFGTEDGSPPANNWKRFRSLVEARTAAKQARASMVGTSNKRPKLTLVTRTLGETRR